MRAQAVDLAPYMNAHAATYDGDRAAGFVNIWGNSFPAEEVPFGRTLLVGGTAYRLPDKSPGAPDHIEVLGERIEVGLAAACHAVGVLGFGELGPQPLEMILADRFGAVQRARVILPGWLAEHGALRGHAAGPPAWQASHLHYVGGYELDHLCPVLHGVTVRLRAPVRPLTITLVPNPLAHVLALTLLCEDRHG